jgi:hypothetical protein
MPCPRPGVQLQKESEVNVFGIRKKGPTRPVRLGMRRHAQSFSLRTEVPVARERPVPPPPEPEPSPPTPVPEPEPEPKPEPEPVP